MEYKGLGEAIIKVTNLEKFPELKDKSFQMKRTQQ